MRVLLDTTYARRAPHSGTAIYLERLQDALARLDGVQLAPATNDRRRMPAGGGLGSVRNLLADSWWTAVQLPRLARSSSVDLIHHPLPARVPATRVPQVVTVLDLAFEWLPGHFDRRYRIYAHQTHRAAARAAAAVICISETTAADVRSLWRVPAARIVVAPLGPGQQLAEHAVREFAEPTHFLYVGDAEPRKNLQVLLAAYGTYRERVPGPLELVLAGSVEARGPGIRVERDPSRERLAELYAAAAALVHPSLYEGFGLTPLEAMSMGTPVVAARSPGVAEVCGEAARYADASDPGSFAAAMVEISRDPALRRELGARGRVRAADFSWSKCAQRHADAYSLAVGA
jgi:glycosyltransferase involved in cell wall biosynthesis